MRDETNELSENRDCIYIFYYSNHLFVTFFLMLKLLYGAGWLVCIANALLLFLEDFIH